MDSVSRPHLTAARSSDHLKPYRIPRWISKALQRKGTERNRWQASSGPLAAQRTKEFKRAKLAPRERKKRRQRVNMETATNAHLPHLLMGAMPEGIDQ